MSVKCGGAHSAVIIEEEITVEDGPVKNNTSGTSSTPPMPRSTESEN